MTNIEYQPRTVELACGVTKLCEEQHDDNQVVLFLAYAPRGGGRGWCAEILTPSLPNFGTERQLMAEKFKYVMQLEAAIKEQYDAYYAAN